MLKIHTFNVALGDSIIIESVVKGENVYSIVDCKKFQSKVPLVDFLSANNVVDISTLFISHFHDDHTSGLFDLYEYLKASNGTLNYIVSPNLGDEGEFKDNFFKILYREIPKEKKDRLFEAIRGLKSLPTKLHSEENPTHSKSTFRSYNWNTAYHPGLNIAFLHPNDE